MFLKIELVKDKRKMKPWIKYIIKEGYYFMNIEIYCCYSLNLRNYLYKNGLRYKLCALNPNSQKRFWVYIKDEKLNKLLNEWSSNEK